MNHGQDKTSLDDSARHKRLAEARAALVGLLSLARAGGRRLESGSGKDAGKGKKTRRSEQ